LERAVTEATQALVLDLVEWVADQPRTYAETMVAWRTSCPGLTIWEDAIDQGFIVREHQEGTGPMVTVTPLGRKLLRDEGRSAADLTP